jgi:zinc protease
MASCLYDPADCESERTVIISELQGGDNDPEQRLDTEITATAFKAHPYRHPTIGWIGDLRTMTRDDLYGHYRRYYVPDNATLVVVGDVDAADVLRRVDAAFGGIPAGGQARPRATEEPPQEGERRVYLRKPGTTAYWRASFHAPRFTDPDFFPLLCADALLTGASGLNIWSGGRVPTPQRRARLYRALVNRGLASAIGGFLAPTADPFLYSVSATVAEGQSLVAVEEAALAECARFVREGPTAAELATVQAQLRARFVYDGDSVTDVAHQLGYFATIGRWQDWHESFTRLAGVTVDAVHAAARRYLTADNRTIGVFEPTAAGRSGGD